MPLALLFVAAVLTGMAWGMVNATIIVFAKLNPMIVTLATNFIGLAVLFLVFQLAQVPQGSDIHALGRTFVLGLPAIWWPMAGAGPRRRLPAAAHALRPPDHRGRRQPLRRARRGASRSGRRAIATFIAAGGFVGFAAVLFAASAGPFNPGSANTSCSTSSPR